MFYKVAFTGQLLKQVQISEYSSNAALGTPVNKITLDNVFIVSLEQVTLPDPANPGNYAEFQRIGLAFENLNRTTFEVNPDGTLGTSISSTQNVGGIDAITAVPTDECKSSLTNQTQFLKLDTIRGDSTLVGEEDTIAVYDFCDALSSSVSSHIGSGAGSGAATAGGIAIVKKVDISSPILHQYVFTGQLIKQGKLDFVRNSGPGGLFKYYSMSFQNGFITAVDEFIGSDGSSYERVMLDFSEITYTYTTQNPDGSAGAAIMAQLNYATM